MSENARNTQNTPRCAHCNGLLRHRSSRGDYRCRKCGETWGQMAVANGEYWDKHKAREARVALAQAEATHG